MGRTLAGALCVRTQPGPVIRKEPFANNWCLQPRKYDSDFLSSVHIQIDSNKTTVLCKILMNWLWRFSRTTHILTSQIDCYLRDTPTRHGRMWRLPASRSMCGWWQTGWIRNGRLGLKRPKSCETTCAIFMMIRMATTAVNRTRTSYLSHGSPATT